MMGKVIDIKGSLEARQKEDAVFQAKMNRVSALVRAFAAHFAAGGTIEELQNSVNVARDELGETEGRDPAVPVAIGWQFTVCCQASGN